MIRLAGRIEPGNDAAIFGGQSESRSLPMPRKARCLSADDGPSDPPTGLRVVSFFADALLAPLFFGLAVACLGPGDAGAFTGLTRVVVSCAVVAPILIARADVGDSAIADAPRTAQSLWLPVRRLARAVLQQFSCATSNALRHALRHVLRNVLVIMRGR